MNKRILFKIIVLGVAALVLLGVLLFRLTLAPGGDWTLWRGFYNMIGAEMVTVQEQEFPSQDLREISIGVSRADIAVYKGDASTLRVKLLSDRPQAPAGFDASEKDGRVEIRGREWVDIISLFRVGAGRFRLEVTLPQGYAGELALSTASGDVALPDALLVSGLRVALSSGDLSGGQIDTPRAELTLASGDAALTALTSGDYRLNLASGSVSLGTLSGKGRLSAMSGDMRIDAIEGEAELSAASGDIALGGCAIGGKITAQSGDITLGGLRPAGDLAVRATSGEITVTFAKDAAAFLEAKALSGGIHSTLPMTLSGSPKQVSGQVGASPSSKLTLETISGDIRIAAE